MKYLLIIILFLELALSFSQAQPSKGNDNVCSLKQTDSVSIRIMAPKHIARYIDTMTAFINNGGVDPSEAWKFIKKHIRISYTSDIIKASAEAAAEFIPTAGGPEHASIAYLKLKDKIAYVLLDIDIDGWAGVSYSIALIHPLVEKTLLRFRKINKVIFDKCPGDN